MKRWIMLNNARYLSYPHTNIIPMILGSYRLIVINFVDQHYYIVNSFYLIIIKVMNYCYLYLLHIMKSMLHWLLCL